MLDFARRSMTTRTSALSFLGTAVIVLAAVAPIRAQSDPRAGGTLQLPAPADVVSETPAEPSNDSAHPRVTAVRVEEPPRVDGALDDTAWIHAAKITKFIQERPLEGADATEATEVYITYDARNIFIGIYAHYSDPRIIRANRSDRDRIDRDDTVSVFFDPFLDQQRGYSFSVNAYGVQADALLTSSGGGPGGGGGGGGGFGGGGGGGGGGVVVPPGAEVSCEPICSTYATSFARLVPVTVLPLWAVMASARVAAEPSCR